MRVGVFYISIFACMDKRCNFKLNFYDMAVKEEIFKPKSVSSLVFTL